MHTERASNFQLPKLGELRLINCLGIDSVHVVSSLLVCRRGPDEEGVDRRIHVAMKPRRRIQGEETTGGTNTLTGPTYPKSSELGFMRNTFLIVAAGSFMRSGTSMFGWYFRLHAIITCT